MASSDCPASESVVLESDLVEAKLHPSEGQKSLTTSDVTSTIEGLKEACTVLERQFGEGATEVADAYLLYGQALLLKSTAAGSSSSETKEVVAATAPSGDALAAGDSAADEAKDNLVGTSTTVEAGDMASGDTDTAVSLQLAEKVLGYARDAFSAIEEQQAKIKHGDALLGLGKSCLQRKNYEQCASYLEKSLDVQKTLALGNTKTLVETYYFLGVCYSALKRSADSLTELNLGLAVANNILATEVTVNGTEGEAATENCELSTVKGLLQNIVTMIENIGGELHRADADSTAEPTVVEPPPAQEQVAAADPDVQTVDLSDTCCAEIAGGQTANEVVMPPTQDPESVAETECAAAQGSTDGTVPCDDVAAPHVPADNAVASVIPVNEVVAADVPADHVAALDVPADHVTAMDVPADHVAALDVPADGISVTDVPVDAIAALDGSAVVSNITNMLWKRPLEEESQELSKKAKHDVEASENGENNGDVAVAINNADGSHEDA